MHILDSFDINSVTIHISCPEISRLIPHPHSDDHPHPVHSDQLYGMAEHRTWQLLRCITELSAANQTEDVSTKSRRGNSGVSWDPSSQKIFELAENIWLNAHAKL